MKRLVKLLLMYTHALGKVNAKLTSLPEMLYIRGKTLDLG